MMNILLLSKTQIEQAFHTPLVMSPNLLGMNKFGEKAFMINSPSLNEGYDIIIGFFNDKARYAAFKKKSGKPWDDADMRAGMQQIGRLDDWKKSSDFADYVEKEGSKIVAEATGWQSPLRRYSFFYVPSLRGEVPVLPDKSALDMKMTSTVTAAITITKPGRRSKSLAKPKGAKRR